MLTIEIPKSDEELIKSVKSTFNNCEAIEMDSLGADTIIQILVPMITVGIPAASAIIVQILKNKSNRQINHRIALHPENVRKYKQKRSVRL